MARSSRGEKPRRTRVLSKRVKQRTRGKARPRRTSQKKRKSLRGGSRSWRRRLRNTADSLFAGENTGENTTDKEVNTIKNIIALITFLKFLSIVYDRSAMNRIVKDMRTKVNKKSRWVSGVAEALNVLAHTSAILGGMALTGGLSGVGLGTAAAAAGLSSAVVPKAGDYLKRKLGYGKGHRIALEQMKESDRGRSDNREFRIEIVKFFFELYPALDTAQDLKTFKDCVREFQTDDVAEHQDPIFRGTQFIQGEGGSQSTSQ